MADIKYYNAGDFILNDIIKKKGERGALVYVIFSTLGERESELIYDKIQVLCNDPGSLIDKIFLSHRRTGDRMDRTEILAKEASRFIEIIISNDIQVPGMGQEKGKGADMRRALFHLNSRYTFDTTDENIIIIFLDGDSSPEHFGPRYVTGLCGAVLDGYDFARAGFFREMGRVKKFVAQPLYSAIGHHELKNLTMMSYPLSGEMGGTLQFFNSVSFWQIYGVETGINIDSSVMDFKTADINMGIHDHEHQDEIKIQKMAFGIIRTYLKQLESHGFIELKRNAVISDRFRAAFINEMGERDFLDFDLDEKKYEPLYTLVSIDVEKA